MAEENKKAETWKALAGGADYRVTAFLGKNIKLIALIVLLIIFYIHNRYAAQQELIQIDNLKEQLKDAKFDALTRSSELMERSRQSRIEDYVNENGSEIQISNNPPYLIK